MVEPFTPTGACANLGQGIAEYWNCFQYAAFLNDTVIIGIFFFLVMGIIGFSLRLPMAVMLPFGFAFLMGVLFLWNPPFLIPVLLIGVAVFVILGVITIFKPGNVAQQ